MRVQACLCYERAQATGALCRVHLPSPHETLTRQPPTCCFPSHTLQPASIPPSSTEDFFSVNSFVLSLSAAPIYSRLHVFITSTIFFSPPNRDLHNPATTCSATTSRAGRANWQPPFPDSFQQQDGPLSLPAVIPTRRNEVDIRGISTFEHAPSSAKELDVCGAPPAIIRAWQRYPFPRRRRPSRSSSPRPLTSPSCLLCP